MAFRKQSSAAYLRSDTMARYEVIVTWGDTSVGVSIFATNPALFGR